MGRRRPRTGAYVGYCASNSNIATGHRPTRHAYPLPCYSNNVEPPPSVHNGHPSGYLNIFVYGTLMPGERNHIHLQSWRPHEMRPASIQARLYLEPKERYPVAVPDPTALCNGLVARIANPRTAFMWLGAEEILYGYDLRWTDATVQDGSTISAVYSAWPWNPKGLKEIKTGRWADR